MKELMSINQEPMMSSKEIADLVEAQHTNIKISMNRLKERGLITFVAMQEKSTGGRPMEVYMVNKRDSYVVVAQNSPEFTARLVDRWQELEAGLAKSNLPQDYPTALRMLADEVEHEVIKRNC